MYHVAADRAELHDVAARYPAKAAELASLWEATAGGDGALAPGEPGRRLRMVAAESGQPKVKLRPRPGAAAARR